MSETINTPKVFISYAWTNEEHVEWVIALAERLQTDGVEVVLDQWDFKEGHDKFHFMEQMIINPTVNRVLVVCNKTYADKANRRDGGVGTESQIISRDVYEKVDQEKFIPLLRERDEAGKEHLPTLLQNRKYIDFSDDDEFSAAYERLIRALFGKPERIKPPLGKPPTHLLTESAPMVRPASRLDRLRIAVEKGKPHTHAMLQDYLDEFLTGMEDFRAPPAAKDEGFDEPIARSIDAFTAYRDNFIDFALFAANYMDDEDTRDRIVDFMQGVAAYQHRKDTVNSWTEEATDNYRFIATEMFLYLVSAYIKTKRYDSAAYLIEFNYQLPSTLGGTQQGDCAILGNVA